MTTQNRIGEILARLTKINRINNLHNEGGEGYTYAEEEKLALEIELAGLKFLENWDRETTIARRAEYNRIVRETGKAPQGLGYNGCELKRAVSLHNL